MEISNSSYDASTGIYSYKKDGQWFFSVCPPDQVASKRVDGKWYFVELCVGGGGGDSDVSKMYVDSQDRKLQVNIDKCFADSKEYANSVVDDYALISYVDEQIAAIEIPEDQDLSLYAKATDVEAGDVSTLKDSKDYTDTAVAAIEIPEDQDLSLYAKTTDMEAGDVSTLGDAKAYTDEQIGGLDISVDLSDYASQEWVLDQSYITEQPVTDGDAATLSSANEYTDAQISAIEFPEGTDLSAYAEKTYVDGADQAVQRFATTSDEAILTSAKKYTDDSLGNLPIGAEDNIMVTEGDQDVEAGWKLKSGGRTLLSVGSKEIGVYHVKEPTDDAHPVTRGYGDGRYSIKQTPIVFKCDQYVEATGRENAPPSGMFCGLNNSSPGSSTNANNYFGNFNADIRVHIDKLLNPEGQQFEKWERYSINGTITIYDKIGKLYFKHGITSVSRGEEDYITVHFCSRVPAFGTGGVADSSQYVLIVEGLIDKEVVTVDIPDEGES